jgi:hypothetical protein
MAGEFAAVERDLGDRAGGRAHAAGDASALKRRSGGGGCAHDSLARAEDDLAIGAEVEQSDQGFAFGEPGREDTRQNIAADETAETAQKAHLGFFGQVPSQLSRAEFLHSVVVRFEGHRRQRCDFDAGEQMMHHRVPTSMTLRGLAARRHHLAIIRPTSARISAASARPPAGSANSTLITSAPACRLSSADSHPFAVRDLPVAQPLW